jgi:hypothetical protein
MTCDIAKSDVDFLLARSVWKGFANLLAGPNPTSVIPNQRKPSGNTSRRHLSAWCGRAFRFRRVTADRDAKNISHRIQMQRLFGLPGTRNAPHTVFSRDFRAKEKLSTRSKENKKLKKIPRTRKGEERLFCS